MLQRCIPTCTYIHNMYTRIHRHHTYVWTCIHTYINVYIYIYMHMHTDIYTYMYVSIYTYTYTRVCVYSCRPKYICIYIHICIHTYIYIYISHMKTDTCVVQMHSMRGNSAAWWLPTPKMKPVYFVLHIISTTERQASVWCNVHIVLLVAISRVVQYVQWCRGYASQFGASRAIAEARVEFNEPIDLSATSARSLCKHSPD